MKLILASQSPRRKQLMAILQRPFTVETAHVDEVFDPQLAPEDIVMSLSKMKAEAVAKQLREDKALIIGSDTIVVGEQGILLKPRDKEDAFTILSGLQGREHKVFTGVALVNTETQTCDTIYEEAKVWMAPMSSEEIWDYINTEEPMDKAGAYGIQGFGARYIEKIEGDYYTIMGLPVHRLYKLLKEKM